MDRLEDLPHAALAQAVQDHIVAQDERIVPVLDQRPGLICGQLAQQDQPPRQVQAVDRPLLLGQSRQTFLHRRGRHQAGGGQPPEECVTAKRLRRTSHRFGKFAEVAVRARAAGNRFPVGLLFNLGQIDPPGDAGKPLFQFRPLNRPVKGRPGQAFGGEQLERGFVAIRQFRPLLQVAFDQRPLRGPPAVLLVRLDQGQQHVAPAGIGISGHKVRNRGLTLRLPSGFKTFHDRTQRQPRRIVQFDLKLRYPIHHRRLPNAGWRPTPLTFVAVRREPSGITVRKTGRLAPLR